MNISICSYSFHRTFGAGKLDIFRYIDLCKELGCTHLQPWNAHFARSVTLDAIKNLGATPGKAGTPPWLDAPRDTTYLRDIRQAAENAGLPFELVAVDRAYIYDPDPQIVKDNRIRAYQWIEIAAEIGATAIRVDAGGPENLDDEIFSTIVDGYGDLIRRGKECGVAIAIENHWGSSRVPENIVRYMNSIDGLRFLFDTNNWAEGRQREAWEMCSPLADFSHIKTFKFDADGNETGVDISLAITLLVQNGFNGIWGIESVPREVDEIEGARLTIALIRKTLAGLA